MSKPWKVLLVLSLLFNLVALPLVVFLSIVLPRVFHSLEAEHHAEVAAMLRETAQQSAEREESAEDLRARLTALADAREEATESWQAEADK